MRRASSSPSKKQGTKAFIIGLCICLILSLGMVAFAGNQGLSPVHVNLKATVEAPGSLDSYAFELIPAIDNPQDDPVESALSTLAGADGTIEVFHNLVYAAPGNYRYVLQQKSMPLAGVLFDSNVFIIDVAVSASGNTLGAEIHATDGGGTPVDVSSLKFINASAPDSASIILGGSQILKGDLQQPNAFSYSLESVTEAAPMPADSTSSNSIAGTFRFGTVSFTEQGTYSYVISQNENVFVDVPQSFTLDISVEPDNLGALTASAKIRDASGTEAAKVVFDNDAVAPEPELVISQALNNGAFTTGSLQGEPGDTVHYKLSVSNPSKSDALGIAVQHPVPAGLAVNTESLPASVSFENDIIFWPVGTLEAGATKEVVFDTTIPETEEDKTWTANATLDFTNNLRSNATSRSAGPAEVVDSNAVELTAMGRKVLQAGPSSVIVSSLNEMEPVLSILMEQCINDGAYTSNLMHTAAGDIATYRITVMNASAYPAQNVNITDTIPSGLTLVTNSITDGGIETNGVITWNIATLDAGVSKSVSFQAQFPAASQFTTWTNTAMFNYPGHAYESSNSVSADQTPGVTPTNTPAPTITPAPTVTPAPTPVPTAVPTSVPDPTVTPAPGPAPHTNDPATLPLWIILAIATGGIAYLSARQLKRGN